MICYRPHAFRDLNLTNNNTVIVVGDYSEMVQFRRLQNLGDNMKNRPHFLKTFLYAPSWLEHHLVQQKVEGSILDQGTYLGCGFDPW